jgi:hypothetical protein
MKKFTEVFSRSEFNGFGYGSLRSPEVFLVPVRGFRREREFFCKDPRFAGMFPGRKHKEDNP